MKKFAVGGALAAALAFGAFACMQQNDAEIVADANRAIIDHDVPGDIRIASSDGIVTLTGTVPNPDARKKAEDVVADVGGVDRIVNDLRTKAGDAPASMDDLIDGGVPPAADEMGAPNAAPGAAEQMQR